MQPLQQIQTELGQVSYRRVGNNGPRKVLFFHGFPGSSSQIRIFESFAAAQGLDVVCFDRPGYNETYIRSRDMLRDTVKVARDLTLHLGWEQFEIATVSGGTPYGLNVALSFPENVRCVRVICGLGYLMHKSIRPLFPQRSLFGLQLLPYIPEKVIRNAFQLATKAQNPVERSPLIRFFFPTSVADDESLRHSDAVPALQFSLREALTQNGLGPKQDAAVFTSHWGLRLHELKVPVAFWHGDDDVIIPDQVSEQMALLVPHARYYRLENEGHLSLPIRCTEKIMQEPLESERKSEHIV